MNVYRYSDNEMLRCWKPCMREEKIIKKVDFSP